LICSCADPAFTDFAIEASKALINAECNAIIQYCAQNSNISSSIFNEFVVGDEVLPAGIFINSVREVLVKARSANLDQAQSQNTIMSCLNILLNTKDSIFSALGTYSTIELNTWEDPRPTVLEAWLLTLNELMQSSYEAGYHDNHLLKQAVFETISLCTQIIMSKRVEKERLLPGHVESLSLDGPQTLAMVEFYEKSVQLFGSQLFSEIATLLSEQMQLEPLSNGANDSSLIGGGIITASIYRCSSGAVPPWAIEYVPDILKSLFHACGDKDTFLAILFTGAELKVKKSSQFGVILGSKLAGHYYDTLKPKAKDEFTSKAKEICASNDNTKWRKLKVLVKSVCGTY
jgi:hypothetical protein